jgi:hypothetical protein
MSRSRCGTVEGFAFVALALVGVVLCVGVGRRNLHHWDEFGYLYAAANYTPDAIAAGRFEVSNIVGFFDGKIAHVALLRFLVGLFGFGETAVASITAVYTALVVISAFVFGAGDWLLWRAPRRALCMALLYLLTPVTVYLSPKLLSEVPAMCAAAAAVALFALALRTRRSDVGTLVLAASGACLAAVALSRAAVLLVVFGVWLAAWVVPPTGVRRVRIVSAALIAVACAGGILLLSEYVLHLDLLRGARSAAVALTQGGALSERIRRTLFAFGPLLLLLPAALATRRRDLLAFYSVWFVVAVTPVIVGLHYLEERYLVSGVPGLVGLASLGAEVVWDHLSESRWARWRLCAPLALAVLLVVGNLVLQPRMLFQLDTTSYETALGWIRREYPGRPILVPDAMCEFHFLRIAHPELPVYLANNSLLPMFFTERNYAPNQAAWVAALSEWYGNRYVPDLTALERLGDPPWFSLGLKSDEADQQRFSWLRDESRLRMEVVFRQGPYVVYRLDPVSRLS